MNLKGEYVTVCLRFVGVGWRIGKQVRPEKTRYRLDENENGRHESALHDVNTIDRARGPC